MCVPSYDEMWMALVDAGVQISEIQTCIERNDWRTSFENKASIVIQAAMRRKLVMNRYIEKNNIADIVQEPDVSYMGLTERFIAGLEEKVMDEDGDKKGPTFRDLIYSSKEYQAAMGQTKMGERACNWKDVG